MSKKFWTEVWEELTGIGKTKRRDALVREYTLREATSKLLRAGHTEAADLIHPNPEELPYRGIYHN